MAAGCDARTIVGVAVILALLYSFKVVLDIIKTMPTDEKFVVPLLGLLAIIYIFLFLIVVVDVITECL